jgi:hypothetical protein
MSSFKQSLLDALEDNRLEMLMPSREYTDNEIIWMRGYNQALEDMLADYNDDIEDAIKNALTFSLN